MDAKEVKERDEGEVEATDAPLRAAAKALRAKADPRALVLGAGLQSLWKQLLPLLGVVAARIGEYPGIFKVEDGGDGRAVGGISPEDGAVVVDQLKAKVPGAIEIFPVDRDLA